MSNIISDFFTWLFLRNCYMDMYEQIPECANGTAVCTCQDPRILVYLGFVVIGVGVFLIPRLFRKTKVIKQ